MTEHLAEAFAKASQLPDEVQNALAALIFREIDADRRWDELLGQPESQELLERLADEALADHHAGHTRQLDVDEL